MYLTEDDLAIQFLVRTIAVAMELAIHLAASALALPTIPVKPCGLVLTVVYVLVQKGLPGLQRRWCKLTTFIRGWNAVIAVNAIVIQGKLVFLFVCELY